MRFSLFAWILLLVMPGVSMGQSQPLDPASTAIFAGRDIVFGSFSTVKGGAVVANRNITHNGGSLEVVSMYGGGSFTRSGAAFQDSGGDILFGGDIVDIGGPGSVIGGNLISGGNISFLPTSTTVAGDVIAAGSFNQPFSFSTIQGSVRAGGNMTINGTVEGGVTHGGTLTQGTFSEINGAIVQGGAVVPPAYVPLTLPAGRNLSAGANNITLASFQDITITPGTYGTLTYSSGNTVKLTAGQYVFEDIVSTFGLNELSFDTSGGAINLFITGDFAFDLVQVVNGVALFAGGAPAAEDANDIFIEVSGSFVAHSSLYGTVFAPNGDITLDTFSDVTGRLLAGRDVILGASNVTAVPEPASLAALASGALLLLRRRRRV